MRGGRTCSFDQILFNPQVTFEMYFFPRWPCCSTMQASCLANPFWLTQRKKLKRFGTKIGKENPTLKKILTRCLPSMCSLSSGASMNFYLGCSHLIWSDLSFNISSLHMLNMVGSLKWKYLIITIVIGLQGHIVSMSSMAGITGTPNLVPYCASKVYSITHWLLLQLSLSYRVLFWLFPPKKCLRMAKSLPKKWKWSNPTARIVKF